MAFNVPRHGRVEDVSGTKVLKLLRSLYGLRESSRVWYELLVEELKQAGFNEMQNAPCVFLGEHVVVLIYVDDILVLGSVPEQIESNQRAIEAVEDEGPGKRFSLPGSGPHVAGRWDASFTTDESNTGSPGGHEHMEM